MRLLGISVRTCLASLALAITLTSSTPAWAHHRNRYGSSGGSSGGVTYGSSGGSSGGYRVYGSYGGSSGGSSGGVAGSTTVTSYAQPTVTIVQPAYTATPSAATGTAQLTVRLPAESKLLIQDRPTQSTGDQRRFVSPPLEAGAEYDYQLKVELKRDGRTVSAVQNIRVRAGQRRTVEFRFASPDQTELVASVD